MVPPGAPTMITTGIGFDSHRFARGRLLVIGGVHIDHEFGLEGHSDADVLAHAVCDALLGAIADGDIGDHFPETDSRWKGADSLDILARVAVRLKARRARPVHVDAVIVAECPRLSSYRDAMRSNLATVLGMRSEFVSVKAKTAEGMGSIGGKEGIAAMATATVEVADPENE